MARGSPEVIVKISGFTKGGDHLKVHMTYISRNGKIDLEDENGAIHGGAAEVNSLWGAWTQTISQSSPPKANRRDTVRIVLSMPPGTDPEALKKAVRSFASREFENHAYVFALHTDEAHPHAHLTVQMRGFGGDRLNPRKADLQQWRESFADALLSEGVDCVATPRTARNRNRGQSQARRHVDARRQQKGQGRKQDEFSISHVSFVKRSKAEWEAARERCRQIVRAAWFVAAMELESGPERFGMPRPHYKRYERNEEGRRRGWRAATLYQSDFGDVGGLRAAGTLPGVRNLSSGEVVRHRQPPQGLLQGISCAGLGRSPEAHHDLRRERDLVGPNGGSDDRARGKDGLLIDGADEKREAAKLVRRFGERLVGRSHHPARDYER